MQFEASKPEGAQESQELPAAGAYEPELPSTPPEKEPERHREPDEEALTEAMIMAPHLYEEHMLTEELTDDRERAAE